MQFVDQIDGSTPANSAYEVSQYIYFMALVIQKDFGTGSYVLGHQGRADALEDHYACTSELHNLSPAGTENLIKDEIRADRPVMMHLRDLAHNSYHAVVVDAYNDDNGNFDVHINMGHDGADDGWYDFYSPILGYDDTGYHKIITVEPL